MSATFSSKDFYPEKINDLKVTGEPVSVKIEGFVGRGIPVVNQYGTEGVIVFFPGLRVNSVLDSFELRQK